ncbi:membrane metallo-endopeptidase-like 1 isoform X2 [Prorops nasuta]|uniref:membrane metallo-endopeptidase-like 1 isoform X2 n=1 Tax=Prorops nasuta TaxID=863751 RepID=UPI0034CE1ACB
MKSTVTFKMCQLIVLILLTVATAVALEFRAGPSCQDRKKPYRLCTSEKCKQIASDMKSGMKFSVNPCDDFYEFMCGGWADSHPIPEGKSYVNAYTPMTDKIQEQIYDILTNTSTHVSFASLGKVKDLYKSCMNLENIKNIGVTTFLDYIKTIGGWPLLHSESLIKFRTIWQTALKKELEIRSYNSLFSLQIDQNIKASYARIIRILKPTTIFLQKINLQCSLTRIRLRQYKKYIYDVASYLRIRQDKTASHSQMEEAINKMIEFEIELAKLKESKAGTQHNIMTIEEFQNLYNSNGGDHTKAKIDWLELIQNLFKTSKIEIKKSELVDVGHLDYFKKLPAILKITKSRTIANYIVWTLVRYMIGYSDTRLSEIRNIFYVAINMNKPGLITRESVCLKQPNLEKAISVEYLRRYFPEDMKIKAKAFVKHIVSVTEDTVNKTEWMDPESKYKAVEKIKFIKALVGYPNFYTPRYIDEYYKDLEIGPDYLTNMINLLKLNDLRELIKLRQIYSRSEWYEESMTASIYYLHRANNIMVTAGMLQYPVYDPDRPEVLNYAVLGAKIGHEAFHSIDVKGFKFDKVGSLSDWLSPISKEILNEIMKCFIDQFNRFIISRLSGNNKIAHVNGKSTLSENIVDSAGLQVAFDAFMDYQLQNGNIDIRLEGLENFTSYQLFFMQYANCVS